MSSRSRLIRNSLAAIGAFALVVALVLAVAVVVVVRRPLPSYDGATSLAGLTANVTVTRDGRGVPQVVASESVDLFRAQGYIQAQDRFFQMDYARHVASGRLAEFAGGRKGAIDSDKLVRTMGWPQVVAQEWELFTPQTRSYLQAYADGVNDYLSQRSPGDISVSYILNAGTAGSAKLAQWEPTDSLLLLKAMAWEQTGNVSDEVARATILRTVADPSRVEELYPGYDHSRFLPVVDQEIPKPPDSSPAAGGAIPASDALNQPGDEASGASTLGTDTPTDPDAGSVLARPVTAETLSDRDVLRSIPSIFGATPTSGGSAWVVAGELTESGKPMLASDPHQEPTVPGPWYQNGLRCAEVTSSCPFDVSGVSLVGIPGVWQGHNSSLSWSLTASAADTADLFLEKIRDTAYLYEDVHRSIAFREETIEVADGDDVVFTVRSTDHGPLITDLDANLGSTLTEAANILAPGSSGGTLGASLAWVGLTPGTTAEAIFDLNRAQSAQDIAAVGAKFAAPSLDLLYATVDGSIGYVAIGQVPDRALLPGAPVPSEGTWPRLGWDGKYDWVGVIPADQMPSVTDPASGFIVAANQAMTLVGSGPYVGQNWDQGFRGDAIRTRLADARDNGEKLTVAKMSRIQADLKGSFVSSLVPALVAVEMDDSDDFTSEAVDLFEKWDSSLDAESPAAAYFAAVWSNLLRLTFAEEIPDPYQPDGGSRWMSVVQRLLDDPNNSWWDDKATVSLVETRDEILHRALVQARLELTTKLGKDPTSWQWGRLHTLDLAQQPMGADDAPVLQGRLLNPASVAIGGAEASINTTGWDATKRYSYRADFVPGMRMIIDLDDLDGSRWVNLAGVSGHPGSPHYTDQITAWLEGATFPWPYGKDALAGAIVDTMVLTPTE